MVRIRAHTGSMAKRNIVVVGGSAGSTAPLKQIVRGLPRDFAGSVFVTTHIPSLHPSYLPVMLADISELRVSAAVDGEPVETGRVYVAPADRHLLLFDSTIRLGVGPRENFTRPSIDPMFRSAALSFGSRTVGVILSGLLNDGASGLHAIERAGGTALVQHPLDAVEGSMPRAAIEAVGSARVVAAQELSGILLNLADTDAGPQLPLPDSLKFEIEVAAGALSSSDGLRQFAEPAALTCPDCQGVLSEVRDETPLRFRCQIGHAYTAEQLAVRHEKLEEALLLAMRVMEERVELVSRMARDARASGRHAVAELYARRSAEYRRYATTLREAAFAARQLPPEIEVSN